MKKLPIFLFLFCSLLGHSQTELNQYKYIIVPKKFADFKNENQYQTSTLIKYLFVQNGYNAVYDDALPQDLNANRCLGLMVNLKDGSNLFTTKTSLVLKNCQNQEVFVTKEGISKEKEYRSAYTETIKEAFSSLEAVDYAYDPTAAPANVPTLNFRNDVKQIDATVTEKKDGPVAVPPTPMDSPVAESPSTEAISFTGTLYAQELPNGYQLVDSSPKIVIKMTKTALPDVYIATAGEKDGMVYKKEGKWFFEYSDQGQTISEELDIKF